MSEMVSRVELAESIAEAWNREGINYAVVHGLERYPDSLGRDLDIFMQKDQIDQALLLAVQVIKHKGWPVVIRPPSLYGKRIVAFADHYKIHLEIHISDRLSWFTVTFANKPDPVYQVGPFKIDPWASIVKRVLLVLLSGGRERFRERPHELQLNEHEWGSLNRFTLYIDPVNAWRFAQLLKEREIEGLFALTPKLRRALLLRSLFRPFQALANSIRFLKRRAARYVSPCGPIIAIVGPDGVGKSTTILHLKEQLPSIFTRVRLRHWRPSLLPHLGTLIGKKTQEGGPPRRHPGPFHWLRLIYYFVDFQLGYWLKDSAESALQRVIVYDRCVLDMVVDPVRFGLRSRRGTTLLWRLTPKPDLVVLLWDTAKRIAQRKQELDEKEIECQLKQWAKLVGEGKVQATVLVDANPEAIAGRISELILEVFVKNNGGNLNVNNTNILERTMGILAPNCKVRNNSPSNCQDRKSLISKNWQIEGFTRLSEYAVFPNAQRARLLVPLAHPKAAAGSLKVYNAMRSYVRAGKLILSAGLQLRLAQPLLRDRLYVHAYKDAPEQKLSTLLLEKHLQQDVFNRKDLTIGVFLGTSGIHQKPLVQVMNHKGELLGYVKVGWNRETISLVQREEAILKQLVETSFSTVKVPCIIHAGWWNDHYLLIQEPPQGKTRNPPRELTMEHLEFLWELGRLKSSKSKLIESEHWKRLRKRVELVKMQGFSYYAHVFERSIGVIEDWIGDEALSFGFRHGDFTSWNMLLLKEKLYVFDWEYAEEYSPPGWDLFHFFVQMATLFHRKPAAWIYKALTSQGNIHPSVETYFKHLYIPFEFIEPLFALYLVDIASWYLLRDGERVDIKGQLLRRVWRSLLSIFLTKRDLKAWSDS